MLLEGLGCAGCAAKIEKDVNAIAGVTASLNFMTKVLVLDVHGSVMPDSLLSDVKKIIRNAEPDIVTKVLAPGTGMRTPYRLEKAEIGGTEGKRGFLRFLDWERTTLVFGIVLFALAVLMTGGLLGQLSGGWVVTCYLAAYVLIGGRIVARAGFNLVRGRFFDENMLMTIATIGAFAIQEYPEGVAVMLFYRVGEMFQNMAVNRSRRSIAALMDIRPERATLQKDGELVEVSPEDVCVGDVILVKAGERIPLDGRVLSGSAALDVSALTGESLPRDVDVGDDVLAGSINTNGVMSLEVGRVFGESALAKILNLVENAGHKKAAVENFITKFARYYTPLVVAAAAGLAVIPPLVLPGALWADWIYRALLFLVVSCPCALVISIPLTFFAGIGAASRRGILVKGSNCLEGLDSVDRVVFDKTGTLTMGVFSVVEVETAPTFDKETVLRLAAHAEWFSNHPIALSVQKACRDKIDAGIVDEVDVGALSDYEEFAGYGVRVLLSGSVILAGSAKLMERFDVAYSPAKSVGSVVYVAVDGIYAGCVVIADEIKKDSRRAVSKLRAAGISRVVMLTGDSQAVAEDVARKIGLEKYYADLLPQDKVALLEKMSGSGKLIFVGDGVNDAPAMAVSDIGVAMGGLGSDAALEAADVVVMTDEPSKVAEAILIARKTRTIVLQNIAFALGVKAAILVLGALGVATMWQAVFADVGVTLLAVLNALRGNHLAVEQPYQGSPHETE